MATELITIDGMQYDITLRQAIGKAWLEGVNVKVDDTGSGYTERELDIFLGCLKENWSVTHTLSADEIPKSCSTGMFTTGTNKSYKASIATKSMPALLGAYLRGENVKSFGSGSTITTSKSFTITTSTGTDPTKTVLDLTDAVAGLTQANVVKVTGIKRKGVDERWTIGAAASDSARTVAWHATATELEFEDADYATTEFVVDIVYKRDIEAGEHIVIDDGATFPGGCTLYVTWLITVKSGPSKGRKGKLIGKFVNMTRSAGDLTMGGDAQALLSQTVELSQNFDEEGDVEWHYTWTDAA